MQNPLNLFANQDLIGLYSSRIESFEQVHNAEVVGRCLAHIEIALTGICYNMMPILFEELYNAATSSDQ